MFKTKQPRAKIEALSSGSFFFGVRGPLTYRMVCVFVQNGNRLTLDLRTGCEYLVENITLDWNSMKLSYLSVIHVQIVVFWSFC